MRVVSTKEMREIERVAIQEKKFSETLIIENVGIRGADFIRENFLFENNFGEIVMLIGGGNNGADGLAIARHLANWDYPVRAFILSPEDEYKPELIKQIDLAKSFGVRISPISDTEQLISYFSQTQDEFLVIDAILGAGLRLPLSNFLFDVVNIVNEYSSILLAIDVPTGVCANSGAVSGNAIDADFTLTIALPKTGLYIAEGAKHSGEVVVIDAGFPVDLLSGGDKALLTAEMVASIDGPRNKFAHKNSFGHALIVGGSPGLTGATIMASNAAIRVGTGLVTASTWKESYHELSSRLVPEIMCGLIPTVAKDVEVILKDLERWTSIVIGPGLGRDSKAKTTVLQVLNHFAGPVVVDADAIRAITIESDYQLLSSRKWPTVLTPHIGEFASFMGVEIKEVLERPLDILKEAVDKTNCCFILKGPATYIGFPTGDTFISYFPNDGMATGGSGDVLAGIIGGLLAQTILDTKRSGMFTDYSSIYHAICLGVQAHTIAGKYAVEKHGERYMNAGNIIEHLPDAFEEIDSLKTELL